MISGFLGVPRPPQQILFIFGDTRAFKTNQEIPGTIHKSDFSKYQYFGNSNFDNVEKDGRRTIPRIRLIKL